MPGGAFRFEGSSGQVAKSDGEFGSAFVNDDPTVPNRPASGAGMPPKASQGDEVCKLFREVCAWSAVTGAVLLEPSINTSPDRSRPPGRPLKSQVA